MPLVSIEIPVGHNAQEKQKIMQAIYTAMFDALQIPQHDCQIKIREYSLENLLVPSDKIANYIEININLFKGRTLATKRKLYKTIIEKLNENDIETSNVFIVLHEIPLENWGIRGGVPASEVKLGFKIKI